MAKKRSAKKKGVTRKKKSKQSFFARYAIWIALGILISVVSVSYSPVLNAEFVDMDDQKLILDNGTKFLRNTRYFVKTGFQTPYYKPVTYLTWLAEYRLVGPNPFLFHLNNLLLHLFNTALVFVIIRKVATQFERLKGSELPIAFFTALFFGLHPLHVESVAWAVERKDVLYTFFYLLGIFSYLRYLEKKHWIPLALSAVAYLLSILSKAPGITMIGIIFLLDFVWRRKFSMKLLYEKAPYFGVFAFALYAFGVFSSAGGEGSIAALADTNRKLAAASNVAEVPSLWGKTTLASMRGVLWYLHSWFPFRTSLGYPREAIIGFFGVFINAFPIILAAAAGALIWLRKKNRLLFFAHAFFFITLSPSLARLGLGIGIFMSDRYVYLPVLGLTFLLAAWLYTLKDRGAFNLRARQGVLVAIALLFAVLSFNASRTWKNTETLWTNVINKYPNVDYAYVNRGSYYREIGQPEKGMQDITRALELDDNANARIQRGLMYRQLGQAQNAVADYTRAMELDPGNTQARTNRGNAYLDLRQYNQAIQDYNVSLQSQPRDARTLVNRAIAFASLKNYEQALTDINTAETIEPNYEQIFGNRAIMYFETGRYRKALQDYQRHLQFFPNDHQIYNDMGVVNQILNQNQEAVRLFTQAIAIQPVRDYFLARARSYDALGQTALAQQDRRTAQQ